MKVPKYSFFLFFYSPFYFSFILFSLHISPMHAYLLPSVAVDVVPCFSSLRGIRFLARPCVEAAAPAPPQPRVLPCPRITPPLPCFVVVRLQPRPCLRSSLPAPPSPRIAVRVYEKGISGRVSRRRLQLPRPCFLAAAATSCPSGASDPAPACEHVSVGANLPNAVRWTHRTSWSWLNLVLWLQFSLSSSLSGFPAGRAVFSRLADGASKLLPELV